MAILKDLVDDDEFLSVECACFELDHRLRFTHYSEDDEVCLELVIECLAPRAAIR